VAAWVMTIQRLRNRGVGLAWRDPPLEWRHEEGDPMTKKPDGKGLRMVSRLGWGLFTLGLMVTAGSAARFAWITFIERPDSGFADGILFAVGFWAGIIIAACGAAVVIKARRAKMPPV